MLKIFSRNALNKFIRNPRHAIATGMDKVFTQMVAACSNGCSLFPKNVTFFLTYRCNLKCNVCGQWGITGYGNKFPREEMQDEVDIDTLKRIIDEISPYRPQITMCGGEVLLYKDWFEFLTYVKSKNLQCILTTNGTMIEMNAERLVKAGLDKLSFSIDGPERIHNMARGDNVFQRALRGLKSVNQYKTQNKRKEPIIEIGCTISDQNYRYLDDVIDIAESLEVSCLIFLHLIFINENEFRRQSNLFHEVFQTESIHWSGYRYNPKGMNVEYLIKKVEEINLNRHKIPIVFHPNFTEKEIRNYYLNSFFLSTSYKNFCLSPWTSVYVLPNGDVSPCSSFVAGNIRKNSFKNILNNQKFRHFRNELRRREFFPVCPRCCEFYKH